MDHWAKCLALLSQTIAIRERAKRGIAYTLSAWTAAKSGSHRAWKHLGCDRRAKRSTRLQVSVHSDAAADTQRVTWDDRALSFGLYAVAQIHQSTQDADLAIGDVLHRVDGIDVLGSRMRQNKRLVDALLRRPEGAQCDFVRAPCIDGRKPPLLRTWTRLAFEMPESPAPLMGTISTSMKENVCETLNANDLFFSCLVPDDSFSPMRKRCFSDGEGRRHELSDRLRGVSDMSDCPSTDWEFPSPQKVRLAPSLGEDPRTETRAPSRPQALSYPFSPLDHNRDSAWVASSLNAEALPFYPRAGSADRFKWPELRYQQVAQGTWAGPTNQGIPWVIAPRGVEWRATHERIREETEDGVAETDVATSFDFLNSPVKRSRSASPLKSQSKAASPEPNSAGYVLPVGYAPSTSPVNLRAPIFGGDGHEPCDAMARRHAATNHPATQVTPVSPATYGGGIGAQEPQFCVALKQARRYVAECESPLPLSRRFPLQESGKTIRTQQSQGSRHKQQQPQQPEQGRRAQRTREQGIQSEALRKDPLESQGENVEDLSALHLDEDGAGAEAPAVRSRRRRRGRRRRTQSADADGAELAPEADGSPHLDPPAQRLSWYRPSLPAFQRPAEVLQEPVVDEKGAGEEQRAAARELVLPRASVDWRPSMQPISSLLQEDL